MTFPTDAATITVRKFFGISTAIAGLLRSQGFTARGCTRPAGPMRSTSRGADHRLERCPFPLLPPGLGAGLGNDAIKTLPLRRGRTLLDFWPRLCPWPLCP